MGVLGMLLEFEECLVFIIVCFYILKSVYSRLNFEKYGCMMHACMSLKKVSKVYI